MLSPAEKNAVVLGVIVGIMIVYAMKRQTAHEAMVGARDKATSIVAWFDRTPSPTYTVYKNTFPEPNIVEYEDMLAMHQSGNLTVATAEEKLR